jgi:hypothetical protein
MASNLSDQAYAIALNNVEDELLESTRAFEDAQRQGDPHSMAYAYERMTEVVAKRDRMTGANEQQQGGGELSAAQQQFLDHRARMGDDWSSPSRRADYTQAHIRAISAGWEIDSPQYFRAVTGHIESCGDGRSPVLNEHSAAELCGISDQEYAANAARLRQLKRSGHYQE